MEPVVGVFVGIAIIALVLFCFMVFLEKKRVKYKIKMDISTLVFIIMVVAGIDTIVFAF